MGVYLVNPDYDRDIVALPRPPTILNDIDPMDYEGTDPVKELTMTEYSDDFIETLPACECGHTHGRYNSSNDPKVPNTVCPKCQTEVMSPIDRGFKSSVWLRAPNGVPAFIRINALVMLIKNFSQENFSAIEWLCNTKYKTPNETSVTFKRFKELNIPRGYNHFIENFDDILAAMMESKIFKPSANRNDALVYFNQFRDILFPTVLPLPSRRSIITELSNKTRFCAEGYADVVDAARAIYSLVGKDDVRYQTTKEYHVFRALMMLVKYREYIDKNILGKKEGWFRKQIYGSRTGPTYRGVVTSIAGSHDYEEMHMPWGIALGSYHTHLIGKLCRRGYTIQDSEDLLISSVGKYNPLVSQLLDELIDESPFTTIAGKRGLPQLLGRNPTLNLRSIQNLFVTKIKRDVHDNTIGLSLLVLKAPNCDFDGDMLGGMPILSKADYERVCKLAPHTGTFDLNKPYALNSNMALGAPLRATINNFLHRSE